jgi:hypothetical protein
MTLLFRMGIRFLALLAIYTGLRAAFYLTHGATLSSSSSALAWAFADGVRFDLSALALLNAPYLLGVIFYAPFEFNKGWRALFVVLNAIGLFIAIGDVEYFHFSGKRLT